MNIIISLQKRKHFFLRIGRVRHNQKKAVKLLLKHVYGVSDFSRPCFSPLDAASDMTSYFVVGVRV